MALASDLMGLGVSPLLAARTATAGTGPLTLALTTASITQVTKLKCTQFMVSITAGSTGLGVTLPPVGGDNGSLLGDQYIINNAASTGTITVFGSSGVLISTGATNSSSTDIAIHTTLTCFPISSTQWIAVKGS